jgi:hypothetical protein
LAVVVDPLDEKTILLSFEIELDCSHFLTEERSDRCNQRILCVVISWKWGFQGFHRNDGGCRDGDVTGFGQGAILAEDDPAMGGKWAGSPAVLRAGRAF